MINPIEKTITINALPATVWDALTDPLKMKEWMGDPEMGIEIITDWKVGSPIVIKGFHHLKFENKGKVLQFEPNEILEYNYLSSLSRLPDQPENYVTLSFRLTGLGDQTRLSLHISNFPTETILKHIDFYWRTTIELFRKFAER